MKQPANLQKPRVSAHVNPVQNQRRALRDAAAESLARTEELLRELAATYTDDPGVVFSACHPRTGFNVVRGQVEKLRKGLVKANV
ncbi:hypothetical protein DQC29_21785 [Salmonella enterica subsp. enterica serovar Telelkebir]|nr:hypothetical protein [Salmonella enterica subsp. enterica serovar Telelkebir]